MVEGRITDGMRIAQLLASELTGLSTPPMDRVAVTDADPDAEPSEAGEFAYTIVINDGRVGKVFVHESRARVDFSVPRDDVDVSDEADGLSVGSTDDGSLRVHVEYGAAVKRAVDLLPSVIGDA